MTPRSWSYSSVTTLLDDCAHRWYLEKVHRIRTPDHPRAAAGTAYHAAIEAHEEARRLWYYTGGSEGSADGIPFEVAFEHAMDSLHECPVPWEAYAGGEDSYGNTHTAIHAALTNWHEGIIPDGQPGEGSSLRDRVMAWRPITVERRFELWLPEVTCRPVRGAPDAIYLDPTGDQDTIAVVDHKSSGNYKRFPHDGSGKREQAAYYVRAARRTPGFPALRSYPVRFEYHVARTKQSDHARFEPVRVISLDVDDLDVEFVDARIGLADETVASGRYEKNPASFLCSPKWCPHHQEAGGTCDPHGPPEM